MKQPGIILAMALCIALMSATAWGQPLLEENFDYPADSNLTANGWNAHDAGGSNPIKVSSGSLSYSGYPSSGVGNSTTYYGGLGSSEDVNRKFTSQTSGSIYASFLVNISSASTTGDYFFHLGPTLLGTSHTGRVFVKRDGSGNLAFGLSKYSETETYTNFSYALNTTYLIVLKYTIVSGDNNDQVSLFVFTSGVPSSEPETPTIGPLSPANNDPSNIGSVALRQGSASYTVQVDGIRIGTSWNDAPLPVELTSFTARACGNAVELKWATAMEVNNFGFEVERRWGNGEAVNRGKGEWQKIGFVEGHGTSNTPHQYAFTDKNVLAGKYAYRLKQIDRDGKFKYHSEVEVTVAAPTKYALEQNYPNPFNPSTTIGFSLPMSGNVTLKVYNMLGQEVATLVNGKLEAGMHSVVWAPKELASGMYVYRLQASNFAAAKKLMLTK